MSRTSQLIVNILMFQAGWFICILAGSLWGGIYTLLALCAHLYYISKIRGEWLLIMSVVLIGIIWDSAIMHLGYLTFNGEYSVIPIWLICLWALFASTLCHSLMWLSKNVWLSISFGALFAPLSYYAGVQLGAAEFSSDSYSSLLCISLGWLVILPLLMKLAAKVSSTDNTQTQTVDALEGVL